MVSEQVLHTQHRCFSRLDDAWQAEFGDEAERTRWAELLRSGVAIFDLDYDAILAAMYALSVSAEGDCYLYVPPDPGIKAAALGASESVLPGTAPAEALHTFTLDSGASRCFFRDSTTLTPLSAPVPVRLADPSRGPVLARSSTVLPCPAVSSGSLSGLHLPSFSTNLVSSTALQDVMVTTTNPGGSSLYTLATEPPRVAGSAQVSSSGQAAPPCSCCLLSHQNLLWHHRLGHPSLPRLRVMHSRLLVSGLPRALPPLLPSPAPPCLPCVEGRQRATPHSSSLPPTTSPLQTLHMDVWGPARVSGQGRERYFLLAVDDYTRYTTVFPLRNKGQVVDVLIPWIRGVHLQLRERFRTDLPVLRLHSDRGGEFSSNLLRDFYRGEGILQTFLLPASPQQNGIAKRHIGLVMEFARTSMIHAATPHFLWPFAVRYTVHQLNLWPRVSLRKTLPTLRWTGKVGDASVFRFYHPTSRRVFPSQDVTFDVSVPFYRLFPYRSAPPQPPPLFLAPGPPPVDPLLPLGPAPSGVSQVDPLPGIAPVEVAVDSSAAPGAAPGGAASGGAEPGGAAFEGAGSGGAEPAGVEPGGAESEGAESGGAEPRGTVSSGGPAGASPRLSPRPEPLSSQQLREWFAQRTRLLSGAPRARDFAAGDSGAGGAGGTRLGGAEVTAGAGGSNGTADAGHGGARTRGTGAAGTGSVGCAGAGDPTEPRADGVGGGGAGGAGAGGAGAGGARAGGTSAGGTEAGGAGAGGTGAGGAGAGGAGAVDPGAGGAGGTGAGGTVRPRAYFVPLLQLVLESREPTSRPVSPVCTARRVPRSHPPPVPSMHATALLPSSVLLRVPPPPPSESSLPAVPDPESDLVRAASPTVSRLLATVVSDPSFESTVASALVAELVDFVAACSLDYATTLVAESESASPPSVGGGCALGTDVLEDRQEYFECLAAAVPRFASMLLAPKGDPDAADISATRSYGEAITVPSSQANIIDGMWIFRVKRPSGSPPAFKARYVAQGFRQRQGVEYFYTFSPTPKMTTLRVLLCVVAQCDYELLSLEFSTAFLQGSLHEEIWLRRPPGFTGSFPAGTQWSLRRPVYGLRQAPREWHDTLRTTLAALGFAPSTADPSLFLRTDTSLPPFYVLVLQRFGFQFSSPQPTPLPTVHSLSAPTSDESVEPSGPYPELVGCLMYLMTYARPDLAYPLSLLARYMALGRHRKVHWDALKRVLRYLCSKSGMELVLGGWGAVVLTCHADASWIYVGAMVAQELRWLTYLLTDLGEQHRSPPVLYVDNKAMIALCQEHRTKHIALQYFLARELQQCGELRLAYVATRANTADIFTKALPPGDHQRFSIVLGLVPTLPHLLTT
ncbi:unnamed protein product [Closterium sp. NIES-53]